MDKETTSHMKFAQQRLPWIVAVLFLVLYSVTLVKWGTLSGLPRLGNITGWDWRPIFTAPVHYLVTLPISWLPGSAQLVAANIFAALCSAISLGLLARCVSRLPHDRTKHQRQLERSDFSLLSLPTAWIPPLLASLVCGLQLTFWEHSTVGTGEAFDLLLFAVVLWCLLEYRLDEKNWRLVLSALVYGLGITNNYAMIAFLPLYLGAVVWIKGMQILNLKFILTMCGAGLAGLSCYLLLPIITSTSGITHHTFWEALIVNLGYQKSAITAFPRHIILIIGLTSLVPVAFIGIRWPATFGDVNPAGAKLTTFMTHLIHAGLFAAIIYVAFDPPFSPRNLGVGRSFLPFYFLGALSLGYFSGYFLLICGAKPVKSWERPSPIIGALNKVIVVAIWVTLLAIPTMLFLRNQPLLAQNNGKELHQLAEQVADSLPEEQSVVLSDDSIRLLALATILESRGNTANHILVDTRSLPWPGYHRHLMAKFPGVWPETFKDQELHYRLNDAGLFNLIVDVQKVRPLFYMHPSFGYYFERFYAHPRGLAYQLAPLPEGTIKPPPADAAALQKGDEQWTQFYEASLKPIASQVQADFRSKTDSPDRMAKYVGRMHSTALNWFGAQLQRAGQTDRAGIYFERALEFNPDNPVAAINRNYNQYLNSGEGDPPELSEEVTKLLEPYEGDWNQILTQNGPVDEPNSCFILARVFMAGNNFIQSAQNLMRAVEFDPDFNAARLTLASVFVQLRQGDNALKTLEDLKARSKSEETPDSIHLAIIQTEAWAQAVNQDIPKAIEIIQQARQQFPEDAAPIATEANIYWTMGQRTNAMQVYEKELAKDPDNVGIMINLSAFQIQLGEAAKAVPILDKVLTMAPTNLGALMNRALAHLNLRNLKESKRDYLAIQASASKPLSAVYFGLGEVAWLEKDYDEALKQYEQFIKLAPRGTAEYQKVLTRIRIIETKSY